MLGLGPTQVKLHLHRLIDLEYVLVHRAPHGPGVQYELVYAAADRTSEATIFSGLRAAGDAHARRHERLRTTNSAVGLNRRAVGGWSKPSVGERPGEGRRASTPRIVRGDIALGRCSVGVGGLHGKRRASPRPSYRSGRCAVSASRGSDTMSAPSALAALITAYLAAAAAQGYAATTLAARRRHLAHFASWCEVRGLVAPELITPGVLERYRQALYHRRHADGTPLAWATQAHQLTAIRMLLAWAARSKRILVNPAAELELPRLPKRLPRAVLSVSEVERVLAQPDLATALGLRDRAILEVLYSSWASAAWNSSASTVVISTPSAARCLSAKAGEEGSTRADRRARDAVDASVSRSRPRDAAAPGAAPSGSARALSGVRAAHATPRDQAHRSIASVSCARRDRETGERAYFPAPDGDADARRRRRHPGVAGNPGPRAALDDRDLHARLDQNSCRRCMRVRIQRLSYTANLLRADAPAPFFSC